MFKRIDELIKQKREEREIFLKNYNIEYTDEELLKFLDSAIQVFKKDKVPEPYYLYTGDPLLTVYKGGSMNKKDKEFMIDMAKHINRCYRKYYYGMTQRGLPLDIYSFAKGLEKAIVYIVENLKVEGEKPIEHSHEGTGTPTEYNTFTGENPFYRDSVGTEGLHEKER